MERRRIVEPIKNVQMTGNVVYLNEAMSLAKQNITFEHNGKTVKRKAEILSFGNFSPIWVKFKGYDWQVHEEYLVRYAPLDESSPDWDNFGNYIGARQ